MQIRKPRAKFLRALPGMVACIGVGLAVLMIASLGQQPRLGAVEPDAANAVSARSAPSAARPLTANLDRSPVDLELGPDGAWLATANQTSDSVSLVKLPEGRVLHEISVGRRPVTLAVSPDGKQILVTCSDAGELHFLLHEDGRLHADGVLRVGFDPHGVKFHPDGRTAYVALTDLHQVVAVDLQSRQITHRVDVGRWPRYLDISPDGHRLAVGTSGDRSISVVDLRTHKLQHQEECQAINIGHLQITADNRFVYFPWMIYRHNPINVRTIKLGWVLASRLARVKMDGPATREALSMDVPEEAMSDPFGLRMTSDEQKIVVSSSGTHELLVYRMHDLPLIGAGGPGDLIDPKLRYDRDRFHRIATGGRPMGLRIAPDNRTVYVANYLDNSIQVVDLEERKQTGTIELGGPEEMNQVRYGEALFFDAKLSLDQWYSCHSCHYDGGANAVPIDTHNDGSVRTFKTVLPLYHVTETGPYTWHGWQNSLADSIQASITQTMEGKPIPPEQIAALEAYLRTLRPPPSPYRQPDGSLTAAAERGRLVFQSSKAGCANCHSGPLFTDLQTHDVGLESPRDVYKGFNTPSLLGVHRKIKLLHNGRASSLEEVLTDLHNPAKVTGQGELTPEERSDLIEYLKSL